MLWDALGCFGMLQQCLRMLWDAPAGFEDALGCFGML